MEDVASSSSTTGRKRPKRDVEYDDNEAKDESAAIAAPTSNNKRARRGVSSSNSISSTTSSSGIRTQTMATRAVTTTAISSSIKPGSVRPAVTSGEDRSYDNGNTNKNEETELSLPLTFAMAVAANDSQQEDRILTFGSTGISAVNPTLTTDVIAATTTAAAIRSNKLGDTAKTRSTSSTTSATLTSSVWSTRLLAMTICLVFMTKQGVAFWTRTRGIRSFQHVIPPQHVLDDETILIGGRKETDENKREYQRVTEMYLSNMTLRSFLTNEEGFHLAMAPSFFGFFGYFGILAAWDEGLVSDDGTAAAMSFLETKKIRSVAGASAGAMAAMLLAMGISPRKAADFCSTIDLPAFADPFGIGSIFKGDIFEQLMRDFMKSQMPPGHSLRIQNSTIPVAVTGFDLQSLETLIMTKGCAARSSRASATFPFLFQPVHWVHHEDEPISRSDNNDNDNIRSMKKDYILIDGGVLDGFGLEGLTVMYPDERKRVVNMVVGNFGGVGTGVPPGPSEMPEGLVASELLSISMRNLPQCGPWAMENGPRAVEAANKAMLASLDLPLYRGKETGHYELHIDASSFSSPR